MVETVQKTVESPQLVLGSWTRLLTCPCWPRQGVVEVPQLQFIDWCVAAHHGYDELMSQGFAIMGGEGVAGTES